MAMAEGDEQITLVSGLPRSGTSLMMQMLGAAGLSLLADAQRAPDVDNPRGYFEYEPVKRSPRDLSWVETATGKVVKVVAPLLPLLPTDRCFRVLLMRRDLSEVLDSQRAMLAGVGEPQDELGNDRLAQILESQWNDAATWCRRHARWQVIEHGELLRDSGGVSERIGEFLGGSLDLSAMSACVDPALWHHHRRR